MSSRDRYVVPVEMGTWDVPASGAARFSWEYDDGRERLLSLYQKGKDKQWDAMHRIDWDLDIDQTDPLGMPPAANPIATSRTWERIQDDPRAVGELRQHQTAWQFSQFLHGEQGAMICSARIVESVPDLDSKFYACTQTMDEARHAETYARFLQEKVGLVYPINPHLKSLLDDTLTDSRWDMPYLGMQVLIEGLALAAFGVLRDMTTVALPKQILAYVMQDEARHVAFGRIALRDYYAQLTSAELAEREEFVVEGCYLMRDRFRGQEIWEHLGYDRADCEEAVATSPFMQAYQALLFSRIVPCVRDIGLWGPRVQKAYADMGVLDMAGVNLDELMRADEDIADAVDAEKRELAERRREIDKVIEIGAATGD
jgi:P-aminobenzoate N-oxygenase AurF